MKLIYLLFAAMAGLSMAIQGSLNSVLGKIIGLLEATFIVHSIGLVTVSILLFVFRLGKGNLSSVGSSPWYVYLGGILGVVIIYGVVASIPRLGVAVATTAIIVGQVGTAVIIDNFGLFGLQAVPFTWVKLMGIGMLAAGAKLMLN